MVLLGASGFSYKDWMGVYYPANLAQHEWLSYYSREFQTCEINSTYYAIPAPATFQAMVAKTGKEFWFVVKANQEMTHKRDGSGRVCQAFREAIEPVIAAGKLGCILAQFPYSFKFQRDNWSYVSEIRNNLEGLPLVVEFRNAGWLKVEVFQWLREHDTGFCCVDEPQLPNLLPPLAEATSKLGYVRFHGRNKEKWWQPEQAWERYDYSYTADELKEWVPKIKKIASNTETTFVFANNHWKAQSIGTLRQLKALLD
jgi:uncharacterized protein YecE (DUF72 family)